MNRENFFNQLRSLRQWDRSNGFHQGLDRLAEIVMGQSCDNCQEEKMEEDLEKDVMRIIKRIEDAKKQEKLKERAGEWIKKLQESLASPS